MNGNDLFAAYWALQNSPPAGYRRVEYIESSGKQWIDTGCILGMDDVISSVFAYLQSYASVTMAFGWQETKRDDHIYSYISNNVGLRFAFLSPTVEAVPYTLGQKIYLTRLDKQGYTVNGISYERTVDKVLRNLSISLFCQTYNSQSSYNNYASARFYSFNIAGKRNYVPYVRIADSKPGMYDLCGSICPLTNSPFYVNAATGPDFTWGELQS